MHSGVCISSSICGLKLWGSQIRAFLAINHNLLSIWHLDRVVVTSFRLIVYLQSYYTSIQKLFSGTTCDNEQLTESIFTLFNPFTLDNVLPQNLRDFIRMLYRGAHLWMTDIERAVFSKFLGDFYSRCFEKVIVAWNMVRNFWSMMAWVHAP